MSVTRNLKNIIQNFQKVSDLTDMDYTIKDNKINLVIKKKNSVFCFKISEEKINKYADVKLKLNIDNSYCHFIINLINIDTQKIIINNIVLNKEYHITNQNMAIHIQNMSTVRREKTACINSLDIEYIKNNEQKLKEEKVAQEKAAKEKAVKEKAVKEKVAKEKAAKEKAVKEKAAKEKAAKEKVAKEKAAKEKAAKEKATKDKVAKEKANERVSGSVKELVNEIEHEKPVDGHFHHSVVHSDSIKK